MNAPRRHPTAPCIVNEGTLINKKDMMRALETLENVKYVYAIDGKIVSQGEGAVVKIFSSRETSTLIVNGCIFINVLSFDYLRFSPHKKGLTKIELVGDAQVLKLIPLEEDVKKLMRSNRDLLASGQLGFDEESHAQLFDDFGDDEED